MNLFVWLWIAHEITLNEVEASLKNSSKESTVGSTNFKLKAQQVNVVYNLLITIGNKIKRIKLKQRREIS